MRQLTKIHFMLVKIFSLILSILMFISIIPALFYILSISGFIISIVLPLLLIYAIAVVLAILLIKVYKIYNLASKMDRNFLIENQGRILGWGIFYSIVMMSTVIGFIIALIFCILANSYITDLKDGKDERTLGQTVKSGAKDVVDGTKEVFGIEDKIEKQMKQLSKLKDMFDLGAITQEEYDAMRKKILEI